MATTGEKLPTLGETVSEAPWSDDTWVTPTNIYSDNGSTANVVAPSFDANDQTFVLKATGFDFSSIPSGSTIDGVICRVNAWYRSGQGSGSLDLCQLLDISKAKAGTNQCATPVPLTTTNTTVITKGSSTDKWGNSLTEAWVKDPDFGVALGILATAANADVDIDYVTLEIYYTPPIVLAVADLAHGQALDASILTQVHNISVQELAHTQGLEALILSQAHNLMAQEMNHVQSLDGNLILESSIQLIIQELNHAHGLDAISLSQVHNLAAADLHHANELDAIVLIQIHNIVVQELNHLQGLDGLSLSQVHNLAAQELQHAHLLDGNLSLAGAIDLVVQALLHTQVLEVPALSQQHQLTVQDLTHAQLLEMVTLIQVHNLIISELFHAHYIDNISWQTAEEGNQLFVELFSEIFRKGIR